LPKFFSLSIRLLLHHTALASDRPAVTPFGPTISLGPLTMDGQSPTMTDTAISADINQPAYVVVNFSTQVTFHSVLSLDNLPNTRKVFITYFSHLRISRYPNLSCNPLSERWTDTVDAS
jgi:hypothetical protein